MESEYRKRIQDVYDAIEKALEPVDPDLAECNQSMGSLVITVSDGSKCILSAQPSVHQLWLALASRGTAFHFNYDESKHSWMDDKGKGVELRSFLEGYLSEIIGSKISLSS